MVCVACRGHRQTADLCISEGVAIVAAQCGRGIEDLERVDLQLFETRETDSGAKQIVGMRRDGQPAFFMDEIADFDRKIFGADRRKLLEWQLQGAVEYAFVEREENEIVGYCMGRHGYNFEQIGPVLALNADIAVRLTSSALLSCKGLPVAIDAMYFDANWLKWLTGLGLKEQRPFVRMYRGLTVAHDPQKQFGIMGPEFG